MEQGRKLIQILRAKNPFVLFFLFICFLALIFSFSSKDSNNNNVCELFPNSVSCFFQSSTFDEDELLNNNNDLDLEEDGEDDEEIEELREELEKEEKKSIETIQAEDEQEEEEGQQDTSLVNEEEEEEEESSSNVDEVKFIPLVKGTLAYDVLNYPEKLLFHNDSNMAIYQEGLELSKRNLAADSGIHVITTFFHGTYHEKRFKELMATLVSNLENPYISAMHVLWQGADPRYLIPNSIGKKLAEYEMDKKLVLTQVKKQPTYKDMFTYSNTHLKRGSVAIVTNADIYFDSSLKCVSLPPKNYTKMFYEPEKLKNRVVFALSRRHSRLCKGKPDHHSIFDICEQYTLSHDAFVFAPPIPKSIPARTGHTQNQGYGAENIVIFEFKREGFKVFNPCLTLKGYHLHCVSERHYVVTFVNRDPPRPGTSYPCARKCGTNAMWVY